MINASGVLQHPPTHSLPIFTLLFAVAGVSSHECTRWYLSCIQYATINAALCFAASQDIQQGGLAAPRGSQQCGEGAGQQKSTHIFQQSEYFAATDAPFRECIADLLCVVPPTVDDDDGDVEY